MRPRTTATTTAAPRAASSTARTASPSGASSTPTRTARSTAGSTSAPTAPSIAWTSTPTATARWTAPTTRSGSTTSLVRVRPAVPQVTLDLAKRRSEGSGPEESVSLSAGGRRSPPSPGKPKLLGMTMAASRRHRQPWRDEAPRNDNAGEPMTLSFRGTSMETGPEESAVSAPAGRRIPRRPASRSSSE